MLRLRGVIVLGLIPWPKWPVDLPEASGTAVGVLRVHRTRSITEVQRLNDVQEAGLISPDQCEAMSESPREQEALLY